MRTLAILVAAGRGERMGGERPKAFLPLGGQPMLLKAALAFEAAPPVDALVAVVPAEEIAAAEAILAGIGKLRAVVRGGARRQDSVLEGLKQAPEGFDGIVLVHDAARPLVEVALIEAVVAAARESGAALPVLGLVDTVKRVRDGRIRETLDRSELAAAQTPQGFRYALLARAYEEALRDRITITDEAAAVERLGQAVVAVPGSPRNRKITTPEDLAWAEAALGPFDPESGSPPLDEPGFTPGDTTRRKGQSEGSEAKGLAARRYRVGSGFDAHRLVPGRPLILGGVTVPYDRGLEGHSDGDCVLHAVCDALLGAAAAGDLGRYFPSPDPRWKGVSSLVFIEEVVRIVSGRGYVVENVDVTVVAEAPILGPYLEGIGLSLSRCLGIPAGGVCVKAKSMDGLGPVGRGEGITAQATVLLVTKE